MGNHDHQYNFVEVLSSGEKHKKTEADKQYQFMNLARLSIKEDIANLKADEHQINKKIMEFRHRDEEIESTMQQIKNLERWNLGKVDPSLPVDSVARTTGFFHLPDRKRCQKKMIKKGRMDMEYLHQVQEQLLCSKKSIGMTLRGTQELKNIIKSMEQRIYHGTKKHADEMKLYQEISNFKETKEIYNAPETDCYRDHWYTRQLKSKRDTDWKRSIAHRINILLEDIEQTKSLQIGRKARVARLQAELEHVRRHISSVEKELENVNTKRLEACKRAHDLRKQKKELVL